MVVIPELKTIALSEGGKKEFINVNYFSILIQKSKKANNYMIINNLVNNDVINYYSFSDKVYKFNTFGDFKKFGDYILIEKH